MNKIILPRNLSQLEAHIGAAAQKDESMYLQYRQECWRAFQSAGLPTTKWEDWKYSNISALAHWDLHTESQSLSDNKEYQAYLEGDVIDIIHENGRPINQDVWQKKIPQGVTVNYWHDKHPDTNLILDSLKRYSVAETNPLALLNVSLSETMLLIHVAKGVRITEPLHVIHRHGSDKEAMLVPDRVFIYLEEDAELTVLESHVCFGESKSYLSHPLTDVVLQPNAVLHYTKSQAEAENAYHVGLTRVWQERDSNFEGFTLTTKAAMTRNELNIVLNGTGCQSTLNGLYTTFNAMHADNHTAVDHRYPHCTSNQLYKGILNDASRAVFNGKIFVRPEAQQTNSYQLNQNLLLGQKARIDTKPQLEIFADDVKCTHGATIGQLNEDEIFYLQSRSIGRNKAIQMLAHGFVEELLTSIANDAIHQKLYLLIEPSFKRIDENL